MTNAESRLYNIRPYHEHEERQLHRWHSPTERSRLPQINADLRTKEFQLMFIGHYAIGFSVRRPNHLPSLAITFIAVQLLDLLWPLFVFAGWETFSIEPGNTAATPLNFTHYPYSHSLLMSVVWGCLLAGVYFLFTRNKTSAVVLIPLVVSHWLLDFITHKPDLQLTPFSQQRVGLGLWNHPMASLTLELSMFAGGVLLYNTHIRPQRKVAFWLLVTMFIIVHMMNVLGPPPPSVNAVVWSANLMWLFIIWAWWIERPMLRNPSAPAG